MHFRDMFDLFHARDYLHDIMHYVKVDYNKLLIIPRRHVSPTPLMRDDDGLKMHKYICSKRAW